MRSGAAHGGSIRAIARPSKRGGGVGASHEAPCMGRTAKRPSLARGAARAHGAYRRLFQLTNEFLTLMLDPFVTTRPSLFVSNSAGVGFPQYRRAPRAANVQCIRLAANRFHAEQVRHRDGTVSYVGFGTDRRRHCLTQTHLRAWH